MDSPVCLWTTAEEFRGLCPLDRHVLPWAWGFRTEVRQWQKNIQVGNLGVLADSIVGKWVDKMSWQGEFFWAALVSWRSPLTRWSWRNLLESMIRSVPCNDNPTQQCGSRRHGTPPPLVLTPGKFWFRGQNCGTIIWTCLA
jgi:hypothetical protein